MSYSSILGAGGTIAQNLGNYEARPQQMQMAEAVADAIAQRRHLMVEAGTGVGKSFANTNRDNQVSAFKIGRRNLKVPNRVRGGKTADAPSFRFLWDRDISVL